jgi:hypothetical protein
MNRNYDGVMVSVNFVIIYSSTEIDTPLVFTRNHEPILELAEEEKYYQYRNPNTNLVTYLPTELSPS